MPRLTKKKRKFITATAVVTPEELQRINDAARRVDRSRSYWVRQACLEKLAREGG